MRKGLIYLKCKKCDGEMTIQAVAETKKRGCLTVLIYIVLLCIPIIGWIVLFNLLRGRKSKVVKYAICQNCGNKTQVK